MNARAYSPASHSPTIALPAATAPGPSASCSARSRSGEVPVLHWHGDTFDLPEGVELLASTAAYPHQAFRRGNTLLALQFHAEMGEDPRFDAWIEQWPEAAVEAGSCCRTLRAAHDALGPAAVAAGRSVIGEWLAGL